MSTSHIGQIIRMNNIVHAKAAHIRIAETKDLATPRVKGHDAEVKLVLGFEHNLNRFVRLYKITYTAGSLNRDATADTENHRQR